MEKYFTADNGQEAGQHTIMVRRAFQQVHKKQKRKYTYVIAVVASLCYGASVAFPLSVRNRS